MYLPEAVDEPPAQEVFLLDLLTIDEEHAVISTLDGKDTRVPLRFQLQDLLDPTLEIGRPPYPGCALHVKDLGRLARLEMGLEPTTPLHLSTRIVYQGVVLPMHKPISTLLDSNSCYYAMAQRCCHFCRCPLRGNRREGDPLVTSGPYDKCFFCDDTPAWHHGACCPHNQASVYCDGTPHATRYKRQWRLRYNPSGSA